MVVTVRTFLSLHTHLRFTSELFRIIEDAGHDLAPSPAFPDYWKVMETFHKDTINVTHPLFHMFFVIMTFTVISTYRM